VIPVGSSSESLELEICITSPMVPPISFMFWIYTLAFYLKFICFPNTKK
jgi:hypothetical protein